MHNARKSKLPLSDSALLHYSCEHLLYELTMFFRTGYVLQQIGDIQAKGEIERTVWYALIESFAVHLRNLLSFLYERKVQSGGTVIAKHFFVDSKEWHPTLPAELKMIWEQADKQVAHLTTKRIAGFSPEKDWKVTERMNLLIPILRDFTERASPQRLGQSVIDFIADLDSWLLCPDQRTKIQVEIVRISD